MSLRSWRKKFISKHVTSTACRGIGVICGRIKKSFTFVSRECVISNENLLNLLVFVTFCDFECGGKININVFRIICDFPTFLALFHSVGEVITSCWLMTLHLGGKKSLIFFRNSMVERSLDFSCINKSKWRNLIWHKRLRIETWKRAERRERQRVKDFHIFFFSLKRVSNTKNTQSRVWNWMAKWNTIDGAVIDCKTRIDRMTHNRGPQCLYGEIIRFPPDRYRSFLEMRNSRQPRKDQDPMLKVNRKSFRVSFLSFSSSAGVISRLSAYDNNVWRHQVLFYDYFHLSVFLKCLANVNETRKIKFTAVDTCYTFRWEKYILWIHFLQSVSKFANWFSFLSPKIVKNSSQSLTIKSREEINFLFLCDKMVLEGNE